MKKEDFVGKMTYQGLIIDAGFDPNIKGTKRDKFSFVIEYTEGRGTWMQPAGGMIWYMMCQGYPYGQEWFDWLVTLGDVTLDDTESESAAADEDTEAVNVTRVCEVCGVALEKRGGAKTCSPKCRKKLSRMAK